MVRDRRRIDPETGRRRAPASDGEGSNGRMSEEVTGTMSGTLDDELAQSAEAPESPVVDVEAPAADADAQQRIDELTADLKRVTAEYANYRKRVERDRDAVVESAKASVANDLLTVLDDLERADAHGDLTGAFKSVGDKLVSSLSNAGLAAFGQEGDEFDPSVHEAVQHSTSPEVSGPTVSAVLRRGYAFGERVLRPAMVAVTDHEAEAAPADGAGDPTPSGEPGTTE
ncbi:nucleotide exchange factor GrpE [Allosaccharopolyspora coralli]|uniref:Protein GrpE n=1 Tax=Allosaccharopolyspora coralli TaxID=2665642 RepID=A0A5Q3QLS5_9PSEU|nr:nucleotide exchange factor GrpE [Allosaccharopolyspora coralli]